MTVRTLMPRYTMGSGVLAQAGSIAKTLGKCAFIIGGKTAMSKALAPVKASLEEAGIEIAEIAWYGGECTYARVNELSETIRKSDADFIIGIGGGKALDTAKGCGDVTDLPVMTVPTICSTCADVTALSVMYDENGAHVGSMFHKGAPDYALIDLDIIAAAPDKYLLAGMGDAMGKHVECTLAARGRELSPQNNLAVTLSLSTYRPLLTYGREALADAKRCAADPEFHATEAIEQVVMANAVNTGLVSLLIDENLNGALAHAMCYGLTRIPGFEHSVLHGLAVGYGILVQLMLDGKTEDFREVRAFMRDVHMPVTLGETGFALTEELMDIAAPEAVKSIYHDRLVPYEITADMVKDAMRRVENYTE